MRKLVLGFAVAVAAVASIASVTYAVAPDTTKPHPSARSRSAPVPVGQEVWPMPVAQFLAGKYLERSDVVLTRRDGDAVSYLIRWATGSVFSHSALVFSGPQFETGYSSTFVIEAGSSGVDLTKLDDYVNDKSSFIAIKRLRKPWFDEPKQSRVRGVMLDKIKASYNYWAIARIARNIWFGVQQKMQGKEQTIEAYRVRAWTPPQDFICSGLIQLGFIEAALTYIEGGQIPPEAITDVIFHKEAASRLPKAPDWKLFEPEQAKSTAIQFGQQLASELESVTPEDIARSDKLEWLYFIRHGRVHKISSYDEAQKLAR
ncbi:MAG: hypothetical protein ABL908_13450 [Hyphomicrobium sp.]